MAENRSRLKGMPEPFTMCWQASDTLQTLVDGEGHLLELIASGAPLTTILDEVCSSLDAQIGKVTSLISLPEDEHEERAAFPHATQFGFSEFYSTEIVSRSGYLLGVFEMYCCVPRTPTDGEMALIERAMLIAARAIQRDDPEEEKAGTTESKPSSGFYRVPVSWN